MNAEEKEPEFISMPSAQLTIPSEADKLFPIRHSDWQRLRKRLAQSIITAPYFASLGWACIGVSASAILAYFPWAAAASQLSASARDHYAYISPLLVMAAIFSFAVAMVCWVANRNTKKMQTVSTQDVLEEMDAIYEPHRLTHTERGAASTPTARRQFFSFRHRSRNP
jgi:hypothetical protein